MPDSNRGPLTHAEFEDLYARLAPRLQKFIRRQVSNAETAADLLQETFLRLLRATFEVRGELEVLAYSYRVAYSVIVDHYRRERRARIWSLLAIRVDPPETAFSSAMETAFLSLVLKDRTLLWLAYVEEMSHREIAKIVAVEKQSVKVLLFRARRRLAGKLNKKGRDSETFT